MSSRDVVCLSHLPWAYGLERPHHVMRRFARDRHVLFVEQPVVTDGELRTVMKRVAPNVRVVSLHVPPDMPRSDIDIAQRRAVNALATDRPNPILWVYAADAMPVARDLDPSLLVYDCVADDGGRRGASADQRANESELLARADLVFTAGTALFEAKRAHNVSTYPLPSSVEVDHFDLRSSLAPFDARDLDLGNVRSPRVGYLGVIDHRVDLGLVDQMASLRPDVQFVLLGGLVGVTTWDLPDRPNVQWLGAKDYAVLPSHVASWDVAMVPFRDDAATQRTEPSGVLACIAAGKPVVTTPLDEVATHAERGLVRVANSEHFVDAIDAALTEARDPAFTAARRLSREGVLARTSWDRTTNAMMRLVDEAAMTRRLIARRRESEREVCVLRRSYQSPAAGNGVRW